MQIKFIHIILPVFAAAVFSACTQKAEKEYVIGFSQCMTDDVWRQAMEIEMNIEASNYDNLTILLRDAKENNQLQIEQIRELINKKVDVLVISPNESAPITPVAVEAYRAGIPTIIVDRKIDSDQYTAYVGGNSYEIGKMAGRYASALLPPRAVILEVWGTKSTSPAQERHAGFIDGLDKSKNFQFITLEGKWRREIAKVAAQNLTDWHNVNLVYAHNDVMALGVRDVIARTDSALLSKIRMLGVDGAFGKDAGLEAVADGRLTASFLYPTGGDRVIKLAMDIVQGQRVDKEHILNTALIDRSTARTLLMQSNQLISYQKRIEQQRQNMNNILNRFSILRHSLGIILLLLVVVFLFLAYIFFINRKIRKRNAQLAAKNRETEKQKEQLVVLNEQIKEVTDQKVRFFMNVSHEVRTPLTLIVSPLEKWIKSTPESPLRTDLLRMKNNTDRLTRVINQLLDFRKVESNKSVLKIENTDVVALAKTAKTLFDDLAETKKITYTFETNSPSVFMPIDADKIEKVCVNLLSNAFKFTGEGGKITLSVEDGTEALTILITDNGVGIKIENQPLVFDRFYSENDRNHTGTGIGLHLSQEFVKMHGGSITLESVPGVLTTFCVTLPKAQDEILGDAHGESYAQVAQLAAVDAGISAEIIAKKYDYTVLVVEDDPEICAYLSEELSQNVAVVTACNGAQALRELEQNADITLVLSDVLMPGMDGFEFCRTIKSSPELSHLPVILLTALSETGQRIHGIAEGADDYIPKPFHIDYVKIKIIRLLEERKQLRKRFMQSVQAGGIAIVNPDAEIASADKIFMEKFASLLAASFNEADISIEKISEAMGVSRVHLYRKVKELSGFSPVDYLRNFRLGKAANLLAERRHSISEVAYQTGFSSPAYFSKCFKEVFGMTPTEFVDKN